jgi:YibE/F-like protein
VTHPTGAAPSPRRSVVAVRACVAAEGAAAAGQRAESGIAARRSVLALRGPCGAGCGLILADLGILDDVTITPVGTAWRLHASRLDATLRQLFASAMRVGRDRIASTADMIASAYAGAPRRWCGRRLEEPTADSLRGRTRT